MNKVLGAYKKLNSWIEIKPKYPKTYLIIGIIFLQVIYCFRLGGNSIF